MFSLAKTQGLSRVQAPLLCADPRLCPGCKRSSSNHHGWCLSTSAVYDNAGKRANAHFRRRPTNACEAREIRGRHREDGRTIPYAVMLHDGPPAAANGREPRIRAVEFPWTERTGWFRTYREFSPSKASFVLGNHRRLVGHYAVL